MKSVDSGVEVMNTGVRVPGQEARKAVWLCDLTHTLILSRKLMY